MIFKLFQIISQIGSIFFPLKNFSSDPLFLKFWNNRKKNLWRSFLPLIIFFHCTPGFSFLTESFCFQDNKAFISNYFSGQSHIRELESFFDCIDNIIKVFLTHTETGNPQYYTQIELSRFILYMGFGQQNPQTEAEARARAMTISQVILNIKTSFIGGHPNRLSLQEIAISQHILSIFRTRMRAMLTTAPLLIQVLNNQGLTRAKLITATDTMTTNLSALGSQLSRISFASNLSLLSQLPQNLRTLGFTSVHLQYWKPALLILSQWKKIFMNSEAHIIHSVEYPFLLDSFSKLMSLWFYHKRFLEGRFWLDTRVIQHAQHLLSYSLNLVQETYKKSNKNGISLQDIDELARRTWFLPYISRPIFRLGLRSAFCFLLTPLTTGKTCKHNMDFKQPNLKISFSDTTFTVTETKAIYESQSGNSSDRIINAHLDILRQYMNSWIHMENTIRQTSTIPPFFGSPHKWLNRRLNITADKRLQFYTNRTDNIPLLSHLNWQSHLMKWMTSAYTNREGQQPINQKLWNTMIEEWTAFSVSIYKDMNWESFQRLGYQVFTHGDFLTSHSNGDQILQEEEILELFSIFTSSLGTVIASREIIQSCKGSTPNHLRADCVWNHLQYLPTNIFKGFPHLSDNLSQDEEKRISYIGTLNSFKIANEELSLKDLFEIFLFIHYQENTMEYLDRDSSQYLSVQELEPLLDIFEQTLINDIPLIYTKREAFAFITYFFHYGEVPIFPERDKISAPVRFSNWLMTPQKWTIQAERENILQTLFLINKQMN